MKPRVYLETTILSYLAARPSRNLIVAAHQSLSRYWWNLRRHLCDLYVSELVTEEAGKGDRAAVAHRAVYLEHCAVLRIEAESLALADSLVRGRCIPKKAAADALHIAIATVSGMDYLVTWNCSHINNATRKAVIESVCGANGYRCPVICTPEELMGDKP